MKDDRGLYYYPDPADVTTRVYVRQGTGSIEFRLYRTEYPEVWEQHDWLPYEVLARAAAMYREKGTGADPLAFYDLNVATALLKEDERKREGR